MAEAALWGLLGASSLLLGAVLSIALRPGRHAIGLVMGFGAGVLISAVAYELVDEAFAVADGGQWVAAGLALGALAFFFGDLAIDRRGGSDRKRSTGLQSAGAPKAIVLGTVLDGVPESIVIGLSLIDGGGVSVAVIAAVFVSNLPESMAATTGLERAGYGRGRLMAMWAAIALVSAIGAAAGFGLMDAASGDAVAFVQAFAGGALLTMLADTMMPEAFEEGGRAVGLLTVLGFALAFALTTLE